MGVLIVMVLMMIVLYPTIEKIDKAIPHPFRDIKNQMWRNLEDRFMAEKEGQEYPKGNKITETEKAINAVFDKMFPAGKK